MLKEDGAPRRPCVVFWYPVGRGQFSRKAGDACQNGVHWPGEADHGVPQGAATSPLLGALRENRVIDETKARMQAEAPRPRDEPQVAIWLFAQDKPVSVKRAA